MDSQPSFGRQRVSAGERTRLVSLYRGSGLTQAEFARQQGVNLFTLRQWVRRSEAKAQKKIPARFHELPVGSLLSSHWLAEISLECGLTLRVGAAAQPEWVGAVVNALRHRPC